MNNGTEHFDTFDANLQPQRKLQKSLCDRKNGR